MKNIIKINKVTASYEDIAVLRELNFYIPCNKITTLVGNTGGGKTTLVKVLKGLISYKGSISIFDQIDNLKNVMIQKNIGVVMYSNINFITSNVRKELVVILQSLGLNDEEIDKYIFDMASDFDLNRILDKQINDLNEEEKITLSIVSALVTKPQLLILDDAFLGLNENYKKEMMIKLKYLNHKNGLTILNITHDINDSLYGDFLSVLNDGQIVLFDEISNMENYEKDLRKYNYDLPFIIDLSLRLKYYNVINTTVYNIDRMVKIIWR